MRHFLTTLISRTRLVYVLLAAVWALIVAWQVAEHDRVKQSARATLINRSRDITSTLGLVIRSQRRWGVVSQERVESALTELVKSGEMSSVALLNASGEVVVSAGTPIDFETKGMMQRGERWDRKSVTLVNLIDLGASMTERGETNRPTIVLPRREPNPGSRESGPRESGPPEPGPRPPPPRELGPREPPPPPGEREPPRIEAHTNEFTGSNAIVSESSLTNRTERGGRPRFGRPFRMDEAEYKSLLERRGLHGLVIAMSTEAFRRACTQDLWMRLIIGCLASVSVVGLGLAWRNLVTSSELQMRLLRASELTTHLKEMNLAAAGLAHETRNPLNIIRGMAQMISKEQDASFEVRRKSREIIDETDRITGQLNEFINYSRPREARRAPVALGAAVGEIVRALSYDLEDKCIRLQVADDLPVIEADEQLLRQALFNLLINAVQAVERGGDIQVLAQRSGPQEVLIEIRDNGAGVPPEQRAEIFKPYFTTQQKGTGLGLAVVKQIVLAHGWEIECLPNEPRGAIFRITHVKPVAGA